jgi:hypothetical protein
MNVSLIDNDPRKVPDDWSHRGFSVRRWRKAEVPTAPQITMPCEVCPVKAGSSNALPGQGRLERQSSEDRL